MNSLKNVLSIQVPGIPRIGNRYVRWAALALFLPLAGLALGAAGTYAVSPAAGGALCLPFGVGISITTSRAHSEHKIGTQAHEQVHRQQCRELGMKGFYQLRHSGLEGLLAIEVPAVCEGMASIMANRSRLEEEELVRLSKEWGVDLDRLRESARRAPHSIPGTAEGAIARVRLEVNGYVRENDYYMSPEDLDRVVRAECPEEMFQLDVDHGD